jgi:hypothetical protein
MIIDAKKSINRVLIRVAGADDAAGIRRLAALDSAAAPAGDMLLAEVDGEIRAAVSLDGRHAIADPFRSSAGELDLLRMRVAQMRLASHEPPPSAVGKLSVWPRATRSIATRAA